MPRARRSFLSCEICRGEASSTISALRSNAPSPGTGSFSPSRSDDEPYHNHAAGPRPGKRPPRAGVATQRVRGIAARRSSRGVCPRSLARLPRRARTPPQADGQHARGDAVDRQEVRVTTRVEDDRDCGRSEPACHRCQRARRAGIDERGRDAGRERLRETAVSAIGGDVANRQGGGDRRARRIGRLARLHRRDVPRQRTRGRAGCGGAQTLQGLPGREEVGRRDGLLHAPGHAHDECTRRAVVAVSPGGPGARAGPFGLGYWMRPSRVEAAATMPSASMP